MTNQTEAAFMWGPNPHKYLLFCNSTSLTFDTPLKCNTTPAIWGRTWQDPMIWIKQALAHNDDGANQWQRKPIKQYFHKQCAVCHSAPSSGHAGHFRTVDLFHSHMSLRAVAFKSECQQLRKTKGKSRFQQKNKIKKKSSLGLNVKTCAGQ